MREALSEAAEVLRSGGIVAFPTDTVWGLLAHSQNPEACAKLFRLKGRAPSQPLQLLVADLETALALADLNPDPKPFLRLAKTFWPGALTIVAPSRRPMPWLGAEATVGLRLPKSEPLRALLRRIGGSAAASSLNRSGEPPVQSLEEARRFPGVDYVVAGPNPPGVASTVFDLTRGNVLREGAIPKAEISAVLGLEER